MITVDEYLDVIVRSRIVVFSISLIHVLIADLEGEEQGPSGVGGMNPKRSYPSMRRFPANCARASEKRRGSPSGTKASGPSGKTVSAGGPGE
jgi:hypothetical protein